MGINRIPASVVQYTQYYPSGLPWESNSGDNPDLQHKKYNGKEFIEMNGYDTYDYGARGYYPAIGRFTTMDPLCEKYYSISPYAYCLNNPVRFTDPDGRVVKYAPGTSTEFKKYFVQAAKYLNAHGAGGILKGLIDSKEVVYLKQGNKNTHFDPKTSTITWDPKMGVITNNGIILSPTTALNHEGDHALQGIILPGTKIIDKNTEDPQYNNKEEKRVIIGSEQDTAKKLGEIEEGEVTRTDHGGQAYETTSPTSTTGANEVFVTPKKEEKPNIKNNSGGN